MEDIDAWAAGRERAVVPSAEPVWLNPRSDDVMQVLDDAQDIVRGWQDEAVGLDHVLVAIVDGHGRPAAALHDAGVDAKALRTLVRGRSRRVDTGASEVLREIDLRPFSTELTTALTSAAELVRMQRHSCIGTEHLVLAALGANTSATTALEALGVDRDAVRTRLLDALKDGPTEVQSRTYSSEKWALPGGGSLRMTTPHPAPAPASELLDLVDRLGAAVRDLATENENLRRQLAATASP